MLLSYIRKDPTMTEANETSEITVFQWSIETCVDLAEIAMKVKLAFKMMPVNCRNNLGLCWNDVKRHVIRPNL